MGYDYLNMLMDCEAICNTYPFVEQLSIGKSVMGHDLICLKIGTGKKKLFLNGAHHGMEYLTAAMLVEIAKRYAEAVMEKGFYEGEPAQTLYEKVTLYIVPMVNPDGVNLAVHGIDACDPFHRKLLEEVGVCSFSDVWQANIRGVDINHNYSANWQEVSPKPASTKYAGPSAESEPETKAVVTFARTVMPDMLIAFHSQGGEIYYDFAGLTAPRSLELAEKFAKVSGYIAACPEGSACFGGCKDWFIEEFSKEGFTVEIGHGTNPLPLELLGTVVKENEPIVACALREI